LSHAPGHKFTKQQYIDEDLHISTEYYKLDEEKWV